MYNKRTSFLTIVLLIFIATSCWYNRKWENLHPNGQATSSANSCDTSGVISYSATVLPIIQQNCSTTPGCHVSGGSAFDYTVFNNFKSDAQSAWGVRYRLNLPTSNGIHMPQGGGYLPACDTMKIRKWIYSGCPNN